ncbi:MAG TPA: hypothetical protein VKT81_16455 [Bryobacteraceae bacterium]|nr:hypothetical protein [Bryobacteraceae bacterium]
MPALEWGFAENNPSEELCLLHHFAMKKRQASGDVEFLITVREFVSPPDPALKFFAQADKQTNQNTAPFTPFGWGPSLVQALTECIKSIHRFPYEPCE